MSCRHVDVVGLPQDVCAACTAHLAKCFSVIPFGISADVTPYCRQVKKMMEKCDCIQKKTWEHYLLNYNIVHNNSNICKQLKTSEK